MLMSVASAASSFSLEGMAVENLGDGGHYLLSVSSEEMETEQELLAENLLSDELYETLSSMDSVEKITRFNSSYVFVEFPRNSEGQNLTGLTREQVKELLPQDFMVEGTADYDEMAAKNGVIIGDSEKLLEKFYGFTPKVGDVLHCQGFNGESLDVTVTGVAKGSLKTGEGASFILCADQTLQKFYPQTTNFSTVWNVHAKKDSDELRQAIFAAADDGRIDIMSRQDYIDLVSDSAANTVKGLYMLVAFLFLFALINLVNTLMTNLISKRQELGVLQSVGMSGSQLSAMLSAECLWYGAVTLLITIFIGGPVGAAVCSALGKLGIFGTMTYHFPWQALLIFTAVLAVIQLCYSASAIRFLKKQSLVERIKAAD